MYPVKKLDEISYAKISVIFDETKKGTDDNLIKVEVPFMDKLELEAEQWLSNVLFLENTVFGRKNWLGGEHIGKRFQKYQDFLRKRALKDFSDCQKRAMYDMYNKH